LAKLRHITAYSKAFQFTSRIDSFKQIIYSLKIVQNQSFNSLVVLQYSYLLWAQLKKGDTIVVYVKCNAVT